MSKVMQPDPEAGPLNWPIATRDVPAGQLKGSFTASAAERTAIAAALELKDCVALEVPYTLRLGGNGAYRLKAQLTADVVQTCVVTLEPVAARVDEPISVEFSEGAVTDDTVVSGTVDLDDDTDVEPIVNGVMDVGRVVFETLAASLDPYPRKAGVAFDWNDPKGEPVKPANPFAVLAKLKKDQ